MAALSAGALNTGTNRTLKKMHYAITEAAEDIGTAASGDAVLVADASDNYKFKWADGANLLEMIGSIAAGITVGEDGTGYDVIFYSATAGKKFHWDESADTLIVAGSMDFDGTITNGEDGTGYDVLFYSATTSAKFLWDESADSLLISSPSATSLAVGLAGGTNPAFVVDSSTGSQAAGLKVTGATAAGNVALAAISSGAAANILLDAKGTGTIGIGSVSTGAVTITPATTVTGAITPTGGVAAAGGFTVRPSNWHTGGAPAATSAAGSDVTPSVSEMYYAAVFVPANATITGVGVMLGSATEGNMKVGLFNSAGANVATSASTDISGATVDAYFRIAFTATYAAKGPATYYIGIIQDSTSNRFNAHTFGDFPAGKTTGETYATGFTTISAPATTFTTALGPIASLY
jgi:hypothetical protein